MNGMEREQPDVEEAIVVNHDDDFERTIVRPSRHRAPAEAADELEETIIAGRRHDVSVEETIVVDRSGGSDDVDETIIVDRSTDDVDETIIAGHRPATSRPAAADEDDDTDRTVARPSHDDETIIVDRSTPSVDLPPVPSLRRARPDRRRGIAPPPIPAGFAPAARTAVGPGAVEHYMPRDVSPPPAASIVTEGAAATRTSDPTLPSVARRAQRTSLVTITVFVAACIVSITGLALILMWAL